MPIVASASAAFVARRGADSFDVPKRLRVSPLSAVAPIPPRGGDGHKIVANVAEARLTLAAKAQVDALLDGAHLADVASWADEVRRDRPATSRWHYVDIPYDATNYDLAAIAN